MTDLDPAVSVAVRRVAGTPTLLVASDYDGVLAPIVSDPKRAFPLAGAIDALRELATLPRTEVALVSGRALDDLARLSGLGGEVGLVGSHGAEFGSTFAAIGLPPDAAERRDRVAAALRAIADGAEGVLLEEKPASVAVHVRNAPDDVGERVLREVADGPARWDGVSATAGKKVLELVVVETSKGQAIATLIDSTGATAVVFIGDDVTDETAFAALRETDVGIKVGPGETAARYRVPDPEAVVRLLNLLAESRRQSVGT